MTTWNNIALRLKRGRETARLSTQQEGRTGRYIAGAVESDPTTGAPAGKIWVRFDPTDANPAGRSYEAVWNTPPTDVTTMISDVEVIVDYGKDGELKVIDTPSLLVNRHYGDAQKIVRGDAPPPEQNKTVLAVKGIFELRPTIDPVNGGLYLYVFPGRHSGIQFPGGRIDLTTYRTATGSRKAWVVVALNTLTNALIASTGADFMLTQPPTDGVAQANIASVLATAAFDAAIPLAAVMLSNSATTFTLNRDDGFEDLRELFSSSAATVIVADIDGTPSVAASTIKFTNGGVTDNADGSVSINLGVAAGDSTTTDAYASRPAVGNAGNLFLPNNGPYLERDTGAAWASWGPLFPMAPPIDASYAWINQGGATVDATNGGVYLETLADSSYNRIRKKAAPTAPYVITAAFLPTFPVSGGATTANVGLLFRQASDGKLHTFGFWLNGLGATWVISTKWTDVITFSAHYAQTTLAFPLIGPVVWFRIADNNTSRICSLSTDGVHWRVFDTQTRTDFLTATEVGFYVSTNGVSGDVGMWLLSWKES